MKIEIDDKISKKLQKRVDEGNEFKNIEEYINFILKRIIEKLENKQNREVYSEEDEEKIKERLRNLGYLD